MTKILACVNLKGGVGKTAIAVNFAAYCGMKGLKTALIDLDPQTNATIWCMGFERWEDHAKKQGTVADLLGAKHYTSAEGKPRDVGSVIVKSVFENVDLIPSHVDLFAVDLDLAAATARETRLLRAFQPVKKDYDIVVCDCPPNLTIPTQNALALSSYYVVPVSPDFLSGLGVGLLLKRVKELSDDLDNPLKHVGIIISRMGRRAAHREGIVKALRERFPDQVFEVEIKERVKVSEAAENSKSIFQMGDVEAAKEFEAISLELLKRMEVSV